MPRSSNVLRRAVSSGLALITFLVQGVFASTPETAFWAQRKKTADRGRQSLALANLPAALNALPSPAVAPTFRFPGMSGAFAQRHEVLLRVLSRRFGGVRKVSPGLATAPTIIHIQDVHQNAEAQKNIRDAVAALAAAGGVDAVALEGAFGPLDLARFQRFPDRAVLDKVADYLLASHKISGPVRAAFSGPMPPLVGVDDPALHQANVGAYHRSRENTPALKKRLEKLRSALENEKAAVFNSRLRAADSLAAAYHAGRVPLGDYLMGLAGYGAPVFPEVGRFLEVLALERSLNFADVEKERAELTAKLLPRLDAAETQTFLREAAAYRAGDLTYAEFYSRLKHLCQARGLVLSNHRALDQYVRYVLRADGIDGEKLWTELGRFEDDVYRRLAVTAEEQNLVHRSRRAGLTEKLLDFGLTPEDWKRYSASQEKVLEGDLAPFEDFYRFAGQRDAAMAANVLRLAAGKKVVVLVTGGYHAAGMLDMLGRAGHSVVSFVPKVEKIDTAEGAAYLSVFSREKTPLEKLFQGEKLFLASHPSAAGEAEAAPLAAAVKMWTSGTDDRWREYFTRLWGGPAPRRVEATRTQRGIRLIAAEDGQPAVALDVALNFDGTITGADQWIQEAWGPRVIKARANIAAQWEEVLTPLRTRLTYLLESRRTPAPTGGAMHVVGEGNLTPSEVEGLRRRVVRDATPADRREWSRAIKELMQKNRDHIVSLRLFLPLRFAADMLDGEALTVPGTPVVVKGLKPIPQPPIPVRFRWISGPGLRGGFERRLNEAGQPEITVYVARGPLALAAVIHELLEGVVLPAFFAIAEQDRHTVAYAAEGLANPPGEGFVPRRSFEEIAAFSTERLKLFLNKSQGEREKVRRRHHGFPALARYLLTTVDKLEAYAEELLHQRQLPDPAVLNAFLRADEARWTGDYSGLADALNVLASRVRRTDNRLWRETAQNLRAWVPGVRKDWHQARDAKAEWQGAFILRREWHHGREVPDVDEQFRLIQGDWQAGRLADFLSGLEDLTELNRLEVLTASQEFLLRLWSAVGQMVKPFVRSDLGPAPGELEDFETLLGEFLAFLRGEGAKGGLGSPYWEKIALGAAALFRQHRETISRRGTPRPAPQVLDQLRAGSGEPGPEISKARQVSALVGSAAVSKLELMVLRDELRGEVGRTTRGTTLALTAALEKALQGNQANLSPTAALLAVEFSIGYGDLARYLREYLEETVGVLAVLHRLRQGGVPEVAIENVFRGLNNLLPLEQGTAQPPAGAMEWLRRLVGLSQSEYRARAWWIEGLLSLGAGTLLTALWTAAGLPGAPAEVFFQATWSAFVLGHLPDFFLPGTAGARPAGNLAAALIISLPLALPFLLSFQFFLGPVSLVLFFVWHRAVNRWLEAWPRQEAAALNAPRPGSGDAGQTLRRLLDGDALSLGVGKTHSTPASIKDGAPGAIEALSLPPVNSNRLRQIERVSRAIASAV